MLEDSFADSFWETVDKNGVTTILERMKCAKQTCERIKHAYEARAILEENYGRTLLQIYQKQKVPYMESATSKLAMESMQHEFMSIAESHINLSKVIREKVAVPFCNLVNKQKVTYKQLQSNVQTLYNKRQKQIQLIRKIQRQYNVETKNPHATQQSVQRLKTQYQDALNELDSIVQEWNTQWKDTCQDFEDLEKERLSFLKSSMVNYTQLLVGYLENELQTCERLHVRANNIDVSHDLADFVRENMTSTQVPSTMEYIKIHALQSRKSNEIRSDPAIMQPKIVSEDRPMVEESFAKVNNNTHAWMMGVMEVYASDEEDTSDSSMDLSETEPEKAQHEQIQRLDQIETNELDHDQKRVASSAEMNSQESHIETQYESHEEEKTPREQLEEMISREQFRKGITQPEEESETQGVQKETQNNLDEQDKIRQHQAQPIFEPLQDIVEPEHTQKEKETQLEEKIDQNTSQMTKENQEVPRDINQATHDAVNTAHSQEHQDSEDERLNKLKTAYREIQELRQESMMDAPTKPVDSTPENNAPTSRRRRSTLIEKFRNSYFFDKQPKKSNVEVDTFQNYRPTSIITNNEETFNHIHPLATIEKPEVPLHTINLSYSKEQLQSHEFFRSYIEPPKESTSIITSDHGFDNQEEHIDTQPKTKVDKEEKKPYHSYIKNSNDSLAIKSNKQKRSKSTDKTDPPRSYIKSPRKSLVVDTSKPKLNESKPIDLKEDNISASPVTAHMIRDRILENKSKPSNSYVPSAPLIPNGDSVYNENDDFYNVGAKKERFIDFATVSYNYEGEGEDEIAIRKGDLLGIVSKGRDNGPGWWKASVLSPRTRKVIRTGLVPSNFLKLASKQ